MGLTEKVLYCLEIAKREIISEEEVHILDGLSVEPESEGRLGKVFGRSISDYAIATWKWIGNDRKFHMYFDQLDKNRQTRIMELVDREVYKQLN